MMRLSSTDMKDINMPTLYDPLRMEKSNSLRIWFTPHVPAIVCSLCYSARVKEWQRDWHCRGWEGPNRLPLSWSTPWWVLHSSQHEIGRYVTKSHCFQWQQDSLPDWDWSMQDLLPYETLASLWKRQTPTSIVIWGLFPSCGPVFQGRLLTYHSGGRHGDEKGLRWWFSSLAGCREELLDPPNLASMTAVACSMFSKKEFGPLGFSHRGEYIGGRVMSGGGPGVHTTWWHG
jgi:hypothetical protein